MMTIAAHDVLALIDVPAMLINRAQVTYANPAALDLLGAHIIGQDVRIAIRNPAAVALLASARAGATKLEGLSVPGSKWQLHCNILPDGKCWPR